MLSVVGLEQAVLSNEMCFRAGSMRICYIVRFCYINSTSVARFNKILQAEITTELIKLFDYNDSHLVFIYIQVKAHSI